MHSSKIPYHFLIIFLSFYLCSDLQAKQEHVYFVPKPLNSSIEISHKAPSAEEFIALRAAAGMRPRSIGSAEKGLKNSLFWVTVRCDGILIGMGRVIGDGGTIAQVTDIAVHPHYQKQGYGQLILETIQTYILKEIPDDAFVCLFAEKEVAPFYQRYGYCLSQEQWPGMYWPCAERQRFKTK